MRLKTLFSYGLTVLVLLGGMALSAEPEEGAKAAHKKCLDAARALARSENDAWARTETLLEITLAYARAGYAKEADETARETISAIAQETNTTSHLARFIQSMAEAGLPQLAREGLKSLDNPESEIRAIIGIARAEAARGDTQQAIATLREVAARLQQLEGQQRLGIVLRIIGEACPSLKNTEAASEFLRVSITAAKRLDKSSADDTLESIASSAHACGLYELAREAALAISSPGARARALLSLAQLPSPAKSDKVKMFLENLPQAAAKLGPEDRAQVLSQAALLYAQTGLRENAASTLSECKQALSSAVPDVRTDQARGTMVDAWLHLDNEAEALSLPRSMSTETAQATAYTLLVRHLAAKGNYDKAVQVATMPASEFVVARLLSTVVEECARTRQYDRASQITGRMKNTLFQAQAQRAAAGQAAKNGDLSEAVQFVNSIADATERDGVFTKTALEYIKAKGSDAIKDLPELERQASRIRIPADRASVLTELARLCQRTNRPQDAARLAKAIRETPDLMGKGADKAAIASVMAEIGDKETARKLFDEAIANAKAGCTCSLARALADIRQRMIAAGMLDAALEGMRKIGQPHETAQGLVAIAGEYTKVGRREEARALLGEAIGLVSEIKDIQKRTSLLSELGVAYERYGLSPGEKESKALDDIIASGKAVALLPPPGSKEIYLLLFYRPGCADCEKAKRLMEEIGREVPGLTSKAMNILESEGAVQNKALCLKLRLPRERHGLVPSIFSSEAALIGGDVTRPEVLKLAESARGKRPPWQLDPNTQMSALSATDQTIHSLTPVVVLAAGLTDGINPCAFAVIIFFVAYMAYVGKSRREIALAGSVYTAAVFLTYLAIGIVLSKVVELEIFATGPVRTVIYIAMIALLLVAAVLSFRDGVLCSGGRTQEVTLKLPDGLKRRIHRIMTQRTREGLTLVSALSLGVVVAMIEFPCTGQTYVPIILYLSQSPMGGFGWLVLYNVCFTLPLLVLFLFILFGCTSQQVTAFFQRHLAKTKFALGALFLLLAAVLLLQIL